MSLEASRFLRAANRQPVDRTPVWFMRQAGRVLPEYRSVRDKLSLLEICRRPEVCADVTLQPVRRFALDAAILFADIMHPLVGAGVDLDIVDGVGPIIQHPVRTADDVAALRTLEPEADLPYVLDSIRLIKRELGDRLPLIGFAGAPFTLAAYLIEGKASRDFVNTKRLMYGAPDVWHTLMGKLADMVAAFMRAQRAAGVDTLQLFDSWVGCLSPDDYVRYVQPYSRRIFTALADLDIPRIHFGVNTATLLPHMKDDGGTVVGVDWRLPLDTAWQVIGTHRAIQGNLDPTVLLGAPDVIQREVHAILARAAGRPGHIFNLGHGLLPMTPISGIERALECIHTYHAGAPSASSALSTAGD